MPCSMTGYARTSIEFRDQLLTMELQSVNHRYRDFQVHLPFPSLELERVFRSWLEKEISRGKVSFSIRGDLSSQAGNIHLNQARIENYVHSACSMQKEFDLKEPPGLSELFTLPGVISILEDQEWTSEFQVAAQIPFQKLIEEFQSCRETEGQVLSDSLKTYSGAIREGMGKVSGFREGVLEENLERLRQKLAQFLDQNLDEGRLHMEAAIIVEKMDIEEELVRLGAHLDSVDALLGSEGECGKRLNFLCQEIHREINTIGSKSSDLQIIQEVIEAKSNLEKIREQIQNLE